MGERCRAEVELKDGGTIAFAGEVIRREEADGTLAIRMTEIDVDSLEQLHALIATHFTAFDRRVGQRTA
jgi:diaminopimelate decarboxylase